MISIPIRRYVATESHALSFRQLCADHVSPIRNRRRCVASEHGVRYADVVRGYEVSPGNFVVIEEWDLDDLPHPSRRVIGISALVPQHAIKGGLFFKPPTTSSPSQLRESQRAPDTGNRRHRDDGDRQHRLPRP